MADDFKYDVFLSRNSTYRGKEFFAGTEMKQRVRELQAAPKGRDSIAGGIAPEISGKKIKPCRGAITYLALTGLV